MTKKLVLSAQKSTITMIQIEYGSLKVKFHGNSVEDLT